MKSRPSTHLEPQKVLVTSANITHIQDKQTWNIGNYHLNQKQRNKIPLKLIVFTFHTSALCSLLCTVLSLDG